MAFGTVLGCSNGFPFQLFRLWALADVLRRSMILAFSGHVWQGIALFVIATFLLLIDNLLEPIMIGTAANM